MKDEFLTWKIEDGTIKEDIDMTNEKLVEKRKFQVVNYMAANIGPIGKKSADFDPEFGIKNIELKLLDQFVRVFEKPHELFKDVAWPAYKPT